MPLLRWRLRVIDYQCNKKTEPQLRFFVVDRGLLQQTESLCRNQIRRLPFLHKGVHAIHADIDQLEAALEGQFFHFRIVV